LTVSASSPAASAKSDAMASSSAAEITSSTRVKPSGARRKPQGVELAAYGRALLKCGTTVFDEMRQGLRQIAFLTDPESGELRVAAPRS
jgi:hypothetical protein